MTSLAIVSIALVAAALLALWVVIRFPTLGPESLTWAILGFLAGQCAPSLGLTILMRVLHLPHGVELAVVGVVVPAFFAMFLTAAWLFSAIIAKISRSGHPIRGRFARAHGTP